VDFRACDDIYIPLYCFISQIDVCILTTIHKHIPSQAESFADHLLPFLHLQNFNEFVPYPLAQSDKHIVPYANVLSSQYACPCGIWMLELLKQWTTRIRNIYFDIEIRQVIEILSVIF